MPHKSFKATLSDAAEGKISAVVSVFDEIDSDGDVVLKSFWVQGEKLPMVWSHDWDRPIGVGTIDVQANQAVFNGELFLDTIDGKEAFTKMRHMADLQEFSFGYRVTDFERGTKNGQPVRFLKTGERFEVSPVLVGANRSTHLLDIKGRKQYYPDLEPPEGSYEDLAEDIAEAFAASGQYADPCSVRTVATFPGGLAYVCVMTWLGEAEYWQVQYDIGADGDPVISTVQAVEASLAFAPATEQDSGISYAGQAERILAAVAHFRTQSKALKEGRTFSTANVQRMQTVMQSVRDAMDELDGMLSDAAPKSGPDADLRRAYWRFEQRRLAREELA